MRRIAAALTFASLSLAPAQTPAPPWKFSEAMKDLAANPHFVEAFLARIDRNPAAGMLLGPENLKRLRELMLGKDWEKLDSFPGITLPNLGRGVWVAGKTIAKPAPAEPDVVPPDDELILPVKDTADPPPAEPEDLGFDLTWGDLPDEALLSMRASSLRLAEVLNRVSLHGEDGYRVRTAAGSAATPAELIALLQRQGFQVSAYDARYFANFGDLRYRNRDVATPFWIDTGLGVPATKRTLLVPATHSQTEIQVERGTRVAAVAFYFGIDGKAAYRAIDTADQAWVGLRRAHIWEGDRAQAAARAVGEVMRAYRQAQQAYPNLPFGGYHALGVCNDASAMVEQLLEGKTTLFPLVADRRHFDHVAAMKPVFDALPNDRNGMSAKDFPRILASMPYDDPARIPLPQLRADLVAIQAAGGAGGAAPSWLGFAAAAGVGATVVVWWWLRRRRSPARTVE